MSKKKKVVKKRAVSGAKSKARSGSRSKPKAKGKLKPKAASRSKAKKTVPIMGYKAPSIVKAPKGPKVTKSPYSKSEQELFRKLLTDLKKKIVGNLQSIEGEHLNTSQKDSSGDLSGYGLHMADAATDSFDRELNIGLVSNKQRFLNDVQNALKKIEDGTYGICEKYGVAIPKKRLLAAPYVRFCLQAQEEFEKEPRRA